MRNNIAFRLTAQNSLRVNEVANREEKTLLNTFKAGSDLRSQLNKVKAPTKMTKVQGTSKFEREEHLMDDEVLKQEVAALDHFKVAVTREKTKNVIENIKLRRRETHIDTLSRFKEDVDEYKENLVSAYESLINDIEQVMAIKITSVEDFLTSCHNKEYLLSREKDLLDEIDDQTLNYKIECETKLNFAKEELLRIQADREEMAREICNSLSMALIEIAFILEPEAKEIELQERNAIKTMEKERFIEFEERLGKIVAEQTNRNEVVEKHSQEVKEHWRTEKEELELSKYIEEAESDTLRRPNVIRQIFNRLIEEQMVNHENKIKLFTCLIQENSDSFSKANISKVNEELKKVNDAFDATLDEFLISFKNGNNLNKENNQNRIDECRKRLIYFEKHNSEEVEQILESKCFPLCKRNIEEQEELIKKATNSAEDQDDRETKVIENAIKLVGKVSEKNDTFIKEFGILNTKYEIEKAKVLDDDEELVDKLKEELEVLKSELKEALHHIKLEEVEKKCFLKVDEIEQAYRLCHENNKKLKETRTPSLEEFMKNYEAQLAEVFYLYGVEKKEFLEEKNRKECEEEAMKQISAEDKKKAEEDERQIEEIKKKGGKVPPAPKPKDPKKAALELEERKKVKVSQIGTKVIEEVKTETGSTWLVYKNIAQICSDFYEEAIQEIKKERPQNVQQSEIKNEEENTKPLDSPEEELKDCRNVPVVNQKAFLRLQSLIPLIESLRTKLFDTASEKKIRILQESEAIDEEMLEDSLINLDNRLKAHYSLKGTIENEIFVKRSGEITGHKKKYEKYSRTIKEKIDLQTEKFNFLLEKGLQALKNHIGEQKSMKEHIPKCKNLSELQGLHSRTKENYNNFSLTIKEIYNELERLGGHEISVLLKKNEEFIKESRLMRDGGDYSTEEISWYEQMMSEITSQMIEQQQKRKEKSEELKNHSEKRKQELLDTFDKEFCIAIEELAAREGTGKKYGKPKRIAQEKMRLEMNKCEQSQININNMINELNKVYENHSGNKFECVKTEQILEWRKQLMTLQFCIARYSKHIDALKPDLKVPIMIRVNYNLNIPEAKLTPEEEENDKKRKEEELKALGKLSEQKDERTFMKYEEEIEKIIVDESRLIYVGDKAKFLTGNDKMPDFLRIYIANMKKSAETFRISCVRELRESCTVFANMFSNMSELFLSSNLCLYLGLQTNCKKKVMDELSKLGDLHKNKRNENLRRLRPNLLNPKCQQELKELDESEIKRSSQCNSSLEALQKEFKDFYFNNGSQFFNSLLNNYEFLLLLTDSLFLHEDFVKLPGGNFLFNIDEIEEKIHLDIEKLLVMKQKGIKIDPNSERNLKKKWEGFDYKIFDIEERQYVYKKVEEVINPKDKKGSKKETKDPKKQVEVIKEGEESKTKTIETIKTWRQKSVYEMVRKTKEELKIEFDKDLLEMNGRIQSETIENTTFEAKWKEIAKSLYLK